MGELEMVSDQGSDGTGVDLSNGVPAVRLHAGERGVVHRVAGLGVLNHFHF